MTVAEKDIIAARVLLGGNSDEVTIYLAQQAAEKAVKGFLAYREMDIEKTHDIPRLLRAAESAETGFVAWSELGERLTDWGYENRYPDDGVVNVPERGQADRAVGYAADILAFVKSRIEAAEDAGDD